MTGAKAPSRRPQERYAALDLGTNNCRLLIATPRGRGFRVVDAFSRIVRLGEGLSVTGALSDDAMDRAVEALKVCADKINRREVTRQRCIATQACRAAANGEEFLVRVRHETGLEFEIIPPEEEARLAVSGCADLLDETAAAGLVFDIGGGSTEISWVRPRVVNARPVAPEILAWESMPIGVVNVCERFGGGELSVDAYAEIVASVRERVAAFGDPAGVRGHFHAGEAHLLGTSGTVTSIAGVHLALPRYRRDAVDGLWLSATDVRTVSEALRAQSLDERAAEPCIGPERADLVVGGCAILEAILLEWPSERIRVADRGLREGILTGLAAAKRRRRGRRGRRGRGPPPAPPAQLPAGETQEYVAPGRDRFCRGPTASACWLRK
ncbi:MAG: Ppx/GppA phosphatase family protein [Parvularculaceae bacterium]